MKSSGSIPSADSEPNTELCPGSHEWHERYEARWVICRDCGSRVDMEVGGKYAQQGAVGIGAAHFRYRRGEQP